MLYSPYVSSKAFRADECIPGVPGRWKVLRYQCVRINALTPLGTFSQLPPNLSEERPVQAYSDTQRVVDFICRGDGVANVSRLLYHVIFASLMPADNLSLNFEFNTWDFLSILAASRYCGGEETGSSSAQEQEIDSRANTYSLQPHPSVLSGAYSCFPLPLIPNDNLISTTYLHVASY